MRERNPAAKKTMGRLGALVAPERCRAEGVSRARDGLRCYTAGHARSGRRRGRVPPSKEDFARAKEDPEAAARVEKFQKWYSGAADESSDEEFEDEGLRRHVRCAGGGVEEEEEAVPFVRGGRAQAKKEAAHKASFKASSKPNDGIVEVATLKPLPEPVAKVVETKPETVVVAEAVTTEAETPKSPSGSEAVSPTRTHTTSFHSEAQEGRRREGFASAGSLRRSCGSLQSQNRLLGRPSEQGRRGPWANYDAIAATPRCAVVLIIGLHARASAP